MLAAIPLILAQAAKPDAAVIGNWILALLALSPIISVTVSVIALVTVSRRKPPIAELLHAEFATKMEVKSARDEVENLRCENNESMRRIHQRIEALTSEFNRNNHDAERARSFVAGNVEQMKETLKQMHDDIKELRRQ